MSTATATARTATRSTAQVEAAPRPTSRPKTGRLRAGNVFEFEVDGETVSALVLLATGDSVIVDKCDGTTPVVVRLDELGPVRVFDPADHGS